MYKNSFLKYYRPKYTHIDGSITTCAILYYKILFRGGLLSINTAYLLQGETK